MRVYFYGQGTLIAMYGPPRPEPEPGEFLGELDLSPDELIELHRIAEEGRLDS
jgi:hypothetical protein